VEDNTIVRNQILSEPEEVVYDNFRQNSTKSSTDNTQVKIVINENKNIGDPLTTEYLKYAIEKVEDPFKNLTVKDVAEDLKMGEAMTNELFKRDDFPSVNIGKTKTVTLLAYLRWKMERRN